MLQTSHLLSVNTFQSQAFATSQASIQEADFRHLLKSQKMNVQWKIFVFENSHLLFFFFFSLLTSFSRAEQFYVLHNVDWIITKCPTCRRSFPRLLTFNPLSVLSPWADILPSSDARNILGRGKGFLFSNKKKGKEGKRKKNRDKCLELAEQNILIEQIKKNQPKKVSKSLTRWQNRSSSQSEGWMLRAVWNLEQRQGITQTATAGAEGLLTRDWFTRKPFRARSLVTDTSDPKVKNSWGFHSLVFGGR